jgi:hypothetical protein
MDMATFHVFVDGALDASNDGVNRLATAMASRYGLPAADVAARLGKGRFRVKANVDKATADTYARDLQAIGARVTLEEVGAPPAAKPTPPAGTSRPPPASALPPRSTPPLGAPKPPAASTPGGAKSGLQSGLAAAFASETPSASLGALAGDLGSFSLSSIDGAEDAAPPQAAFTPPPAPEKPKAPLPAPKPAAKPSAKPVDTPLDLFAPPDAQAEADFKVDLAPDEAERHARKQVSAPPPTADSNPAPIPVTPIRGHTLPHQPLAAGAVRPRNAAFAGALRFGQHERFVVGVLLTIVLGFVPAHIIAAIRERSAFKSVDERVATTQAQAVTPDAYARLDKFRADQLERKESERSSIAILAFAIWAAAGSGIAYVWFRRIPWGDSDAG